MSFPIRHLPVLQNWDCHVCGTCCKEYQVTVTDEERKRIESQGWDRDKDLGGLAPFKRVGPFWARRSQLNHRPDGSCVFLSEQGRCRIHERFGYETKPLPCRLFPFVLVPQGDHWGVGVRYACPSAAANKGRPLSKHDEELLEFAALLAKREGLTPQPDGTSVRPPRLRSGQRVAWPELQRFVKPLLNLLRDRSDPMERRMRKCLAFATVCRQAKNIAQLEGDKLRELLDVLESFAGADVPADPMSVTPPSWVGRILFRQALAIYTRKDHGPNRGPDIRGRVALLHAAWRFTRGSGFIPRMHAWLPETTFEAIEQPTGPLSPQADEILERYYTMKVGSMQFCGAASFGMSFWEGFEHLALTMPILLWVARAMRPLPAEEAVTRALSIVDDHFGFNRVLGTLRQRLSFKILARRGEISRLIAWYSR
ncbi:MAG: YkgJ family cysteine cluster protein [Planctomycetes bacterium]|nr:YkgJ family cysteine cluster protein [Planctomycetota bacterium]